MRNITDVIERMQEVVGESDKALTAGMDKLVVKAAYRSPESQGMIWDELARIHREAAPSRGAPNVEQPEWWQHAGEIMAGTRK